MTNTQGLVKTQLGRVVNKKDRASVLGVARLSNTALHYAVQLWTELEVAALLDLGANIGVRNWRGETPLDRILPSTLEAFLDRCDLELTFLVVDEIFKI